jgi:hypothetical protein
MIKPLPKKELETFRRAAERRSHLEEQELERRRRRDGKD